MIKVYKCEKRDFKNLYKNKEIVCFGAGAELNRICNYYVGIESNIKFIVDNNKSGQTIKINQSMIPVISPIELDVKNKEWIFVISTVNYADQIIKQLDTFEQFEGKIFFIPYFFYDYKEINNVSARVEKEIIPRVIHYCWFGKTEMPKQFLKNIDSWKRYCPDYKIIRWDESNYDIEKNKYMKQAYEAKKWGFVPDYARLDIVNQHGGIYLDTDVEMLRPWDELLKHKLFCGYETDKYVGFGSGFGGIKNHRILIDMIKQYDELSFYKEDGSLNLLPSPEYQTEVMKRYGLKCDGSLQITDDFAVYPVQYFAPINPIGLGEPTELSFSIHQYAASWFDESEHDNKNRIMESIAYVKARIKDYYNC